MAENKSPPDNSSNLPGKESPSAPSKPTQSPPPPSSSPPPATPPPSSKSPPPPPSSSSPLPASPPPSSKSSPPSPSSSSPPPSPPSSSPPPSSSSSQPPTSPPPPSSSSSSPPPSSQSPPPSSSSPPPSSSSSSSSPPPSSPPPSPSNSSPPPSQSNQSPPPTYPNNNSSLPNNNNGSSSRNDSNNRNNNNDNNNSQQWKPPPPPNQSSNTPTNNNDSEGGRGALSPPSETTNGQADSSPSSDGSMVSMPLVMAVVAGAGLLIIIMLLLFFAMRRKRNKREGGLTPYHNQGNTATDFRAATDFHAATSSPHQMGGNPYNNNAAYHQNHYANDQLSGLPAPLNGPGRGGWPMPSQQGVSDSDNSQATSSGPHGPVLPPPPPFMALGLNQSNFIYDELAAATGGFSQANLLGQGGFGYVHRGILPNGKEIAVKSLKSGSGQGEREFKAEVEIISRVHHRHLVSLVGYCIAGGQRMLVYEFLPNNNLEFHLHGKGRPVMDWPTRLKIALGSAKGLAYLHEDCHPRIIHRDIKTSNILLDFTFEPKVSDFGLAKLSSDNNTHVSTRVMGTFGYLAPEYASSGKLTEKSDVFSFGVMLLELITGRRPIDHTGAMEDSLVDWARPLCLRSLEDGNFNELADPYLEKNYAPEEMARMIACASASIRHSARRRPKMSQIVRALEGDVSLEDLNNGIKPSQASIFSGTGSSRIGSSSSRSSDFDNSLYTEDIRKLRKMVVDNTSGGPYISSEYGATSEYGLNPSSSSSEFGGSRGHSPQVKSSFLK